MNINVAFIGLLFLLYAGNDVSSTQLLLLLALISSADGCACRSGQSAQNQTAGIGVNSQ